MLTFIMYYFIYFFSIKTFGRLTRAQSDRETQFKGAVETFLKRSGIQNIESRPYHSQCQGKMIDCMAQKKTKRRLDILNGVPGIIVL